jgi:hypothetical protein
MYANEVYLGQRGSFAIQGFSEGSAAEFGKDLSELTLPEAATLAGFRTIALGRVVRRPYTQAFSARALCNCEQISFGMIARLIIEVKQTVQTIAVILILMWLLGMVTSYTMGGFIHVLLLLAVISILVRLIQGRRIV